MYTLRLTSVPVDYRAGMNVFAHRPLSSVAKFAVLLSLLTAMPIRMNADDEISLRMPEKSRAAGTLAIDDLSVTPPYFGNRVSERKQLAVLTEETYVLSDIPLSEGILKRFFVYFQKPPDGGGGGGEGGGGGREGGGGGGGPELSPDAMAMLQIWRPEHSISSPLNKVYTLVYSIPVGLLSGVGSNGTMSTYVVDRFVTMSDDVMGFTVDHDVPLPVSCGRNRTREVLILASPKHVQLSEEYDFPRKSAQRLSCAMAVEVIPLNGCTLCATKQNLQAFAKKSRPQGLPEEDDSQMSKTESNGICMEGSLSCEAVAGIIGGVLGIVAIALVIVAVVQYQRLSEEMKKPSNVSSTGRRKT